MTTKNEILDTLVVGIDKPTADTALPVLDAVAKAGVTYVKIGPVLMLNMGLYAIRQELEDRGIEQWFLDGKFVNTDGILQATAKEACRHKPTMLNCMADAGPNALKLFADECRNAGVQSLAVTFLTTKDDEMCNDQHPDRTALDQVLFYANEWVAPAGLDGIVCSALEAPELRKHEYGGFLITPGIRFGDTSKGDQRRVVTPSQAIQNGVDKVVMATDIIADPMARVPRYIDEVGPVLEAAA